MYLDLTFFRDLDRQLGAPGDFAQAYVIAHEVGHHIQTLLGISQQVRARGQGKSAAEVNNLSVRQELPASGATQPSITATCWSPVTWKRRCKRPQQLAMTACRNAAAVR